MGWLTGPLLRAALLGAGLASAAQPSSADPSVAGVGPLGVVVAGRVERGSLRTADGRLRSYRLFVPEGIEQGVSTPLVLNLHGRMMDGALQMAVSVMNDAAQRHGFLVAYPDGIGRKWSDGARDGLEEGDQPDDVGFLSALIDRIARDHEVDRRRVYAAGFSNGAGMAHALGCRLSERIAAIGAVSGGNNVAECRPGRPVPVWEFHGAHDRFYPFLGGRSRLMGLNFKSIPRTVAEWVARNAVPESSRRVSYAKGIVTCESYGGEAEVTLCVARPQALETAGLAVVDGGGHAWPGGISFPFFDSATADLDASEALWEFFARHALTEAPRGPGFDRSLIPP